jgi:hypothetical protein
MLISDKFLKDDGKFIFLIPPALYAWEKYIELNKNRQGDQAIIFTLVKKLPA